MTEKKLRPLPAIKRLQARKDLPEVVEMKEHPSIKDNMEAHIKRMLSDPTHDLEDRSTRRLLSQRAYSWRNTLEDLQRFIVLQNHRFDPEEIKAVILLLTRIDEWLNLNERRMGEA